MAVCIHLYLSCCNPEQKYDVIIRNGMIYDRNGGQPYPANLAINADTIAFIGDLKNSSSKMETDAGGMAIAPGFINMLSHSEESLIQDGHSQSDLRQGVTLEVFGESSMGPLNARMKKQAREGQQDIKYEVNWNHLGRIHELSLKKKAFPVISPSFVGTGTIRAYVIGEGNTAPTPAQSDSMRMLVAQAMEEGAMGITNALIYPPDFFFKNRRGLADLAKEVSENTEACTRVISAVKEVNYLKLFRS